LLEQSQVSDARPIKQVILIPYWVHETLTRRKLPLSECLNFDAIKPLSSVNDLVCFLSMQRYFTELTGIQSDDWSLFFQWMKTARGDNKTFFEQTILPLERATDIEAEIETRLFSAESRLPHHEEPFYIYDITREVAGVVVNPGFFTQETGTEGYRAALIVAILKVLYAYNAYHEVSTTPLFKRYLELLSAKQLTV
jgi:hypothetical protein